MKIELEGREALEHTNAVHTLRSIGYRCTGGEWVAPQEETQEEDGTVFIDEALISTGSISKSDTQLQADIEALTTRVAALEERKPTPVSVDPLALSICRRELFELKARYGYEALHCAFQEISK